MMKSYGLFDVTFLFIRLYNVTNLDNRNVWTTFPPEIAQSRQQASIDVCGLPRYRGPCKGYLRRYYFDSATRECRLFPYGGCLGNLNNFKTEEICRKRCGRQEEAPQLTTTSITQGGGITTEACGENEEQDICGSACPLTCENYQSPPEYCTLQCVIGCRCKQGFVRSADLRCVTSDQCPNRPELSMGSRPEQLSSPRPQLSKITRPGPLRGIRPEQFTSPRPEISRSTRPEPSRGIRPEQFTSPRPEISRSTRPEQSRNNRPQPPRSTRPEQSRSTRPDQTKSTRPDEFSSTQLQMLPTPESLASDNAVCQLDKQVGPCQGVVPRYYYNKEMGQCKQFIFGGCGGNLNSFPTMEDCNSYCVDQS